MTILRFAHAFESGGGVESLLDDLDGALLERNAVTVIRFYIASDRTKLAERVIPRGRGRLILVPLPLAEGDSLQLASDDEPTGRTWKEKIRDGVLYHPLVWNLMLKPLVSRRRLPRRKGQVVGAGTKATDIFARYRVDLCVMHFFGGSDADEVIVQARQHGVPVVLENHYANERFLHLSIRKHATLADGVAGVNGRDVPDYLRGRFCNLADGIDTGVFRRASARAVTLDSDAPLILLPARIVRPKGHLDLIEAAARLQARGLDFRVGFAGRVDSADFVERLRGEIARVGLTERVRFLGVLTPAELRDWYTACAVVALPSHHHEGLPRIVLEAQAMETPVVAYAAGGTAEGIVDGETGYVVAKGDIDGLTERLARVLGNAADRESMGRAGRRFVEARYSLEAVAERHENYYRAVIAGARRTGDRGK